LGVSNGARLGSGHREEGESEMFSFRKAAKQAGRGDRQRPGDAAEQAARDEAASAQAVRLRDLDPRAYVHGNSGAAPAGCAVRTDLAQ
jgi:hypothetical protein